jgi:hypothetical protein
MFADNINVLITATHGDALQNQVDQVMTDIDSWFHRNDLIINVKKTVVMLFQYRPKKFSVRPTVILNNLKLNYTAETKFLGVYITENLKWSTHIQSLANKLCKVAFMIKSLKKIMSYISYVIFTSLSSSHSYDLEYYSGEDWKEL